MDKKANFVEQLRFFKKTLAREKKVTKIILFGSWAYGKSRKDSDVDLIIISPLFKGMKNGRARGLHKLWNLPYPVDFLCYTPEEFDQKSKEISIVNEALKEGIEI